MANEICEVLPDYDSYDLIAGPELGAVPIISLISTKVGKPFVIVKKESKGYGTEKMIEGVHLIRMIG